MTDPGVQAQIEELEKTNQALFEMVNDLSLFYNLSLSFLREAKTPEQLANTLLGTLTDEAGFRRCAIFQPVPDTADRLLMSVRSQGDEAVKQQELTISKAQGTLLARCLAEGRPLQSKSMPPTDKTP